MYSEDQYIQNQFYINFLGKHDNPIVIYGTGIHTKKLLECIKDERIVGLMDAKRTGEFICEKKVLSYDEVSMIENVSIVILAWSAVINIIYRRISSFVKENNIKVFDINRNELSYNNDITYNYPCFQLREELLWEKIQKADVVSFDIFDTLIYRKVMRPTDVYRWIESYSGIDGFSKERIFAEGELEGYNPSIDDIYSKIQSNTGWAEEVIYKLKDSEILAEMKLQRKRDSMCRLLHKCVDIGKRVFLISDMYLPSDILKELLDRHGIVTYNALYVSCDMGCTKADGLFEVVRNKEEIKGVWLHIGDNEYSDILCPNEVGVDTYRIYSISDMMEQSIYSSLVGYNNTLEETIVQACFAGDIYKDPFGDFNANGKIHINHMEELTRMVVAPLVFKYIVWLIQHVKKDNIDLVLFPSRDGFILQRIYQKMQMVFPEWKLPDSVYFYTSRRATLIAAAENKDDVRHVAELPAKSSFSERLEKRYEMKISETFDLDNIPKNVVMRALERSAEERSRYIEYLNKIGYYSKKKPALIDFVAVGSVHEALERLSGKAVKGYYFLRRSPDTKQTLDLDVESLYGMYGDFEVNYNIYRYYYFLESILSSYEPTFKYFDKSGIPVFYSEERSSNTLDILKDMHNAIISYCDEMLEMCPNLLGWDAPITLYDDLLGVFSMDKSDISNDELQKFSNVDEFLEFRVIESNR